MVLVKEIYGLSVVEICYGSFTPVELLERTL